MNEEKVNGNMNVRHTMPLHPILNRQQTGNARPPVIGDHPINRSSTTNTQQMSLTSEIHTPNVNLAKRQADIQTIYNKLSHESKETFKKINDFLKLESVQGNITCKPNFNNDKTEIVGALITITNRSISNNQAKDIINELHESNLGNIELEINIEKCNNLTNLNLSNFPNLRFIRVSDCNIQSIDCSGCNHLNNLTLHNVNNLANLNVRGCQNLYELYIYGNINKLNQIDLNSCNECGTVYIEESPSNGNFHILLSSNSSLAKTSHFFTRNDLNMFLVDGKQVRRHNVHHNFDSNKLSANSVTILNNINQFCSNNEDFVECHINSNENLTEISAVNVTITNKSINNQQAQEILEQLESSALPAGSLNINFSNCNKLIGLDVTNLPCLKSIDFSGCTNLQNISLLELSSLTSIDFSGCSKLKNMTMINAPVLQAIDLVTCNALENVDIVEASDNLRIQISTDCKLINDPKFNMRDDRRLFNVKEKWALIINNQDYITMFEKALSSAKNLHAYDDSTSEYEDFLQFITKHCADCATLKGKEKNEAIETYVHAMLIFTTHTDRCIDACRKGESAAKIELLMGKKLKEADEITDKTIRIKEKLNIIFTHYLNERIHKSLRIIDAIYKSQNNENGISEIVEVELLINMIFGISTNSKMTFSFCAKDAINAALRAFESIQHTASELSADGSCFLSSNQIIQNTIAGKVATIFGENNKSLLTTPAKIILTSMLKNSNDQKNQKFDEYLFTNDECIRHLLPPTPSSEELLKMTIEQLKEHIGVETEEIQLAKRFIKDHAGQTINPDDPSSATLKSNSTLKDIFKLADNCYNGEEGLDERIYKAIGDLTTAAFVEKQSKIIFKKLYWLDTDENYKQTLATLLKRLLGIQE